MTYTLTIPGVLVGLNEYITAERSNRYQAAAIKKQTEHAIGAAIRRQLRGVKITMPVYITYTWIEPTKRRDKDNIAFAKKFVQDALVRAKVIKNDGWKEIAGFRDCFDVDKAHPRVIVAIEEVNRANGKDGAVSR